MSQLLDSFLNCVNLRLTLFVDKDSHAFSKKLEMLENHLYIEDFEMYSQGYADGIAIKNIECEFFKNIGCLSKQGFSLFKAMISSDDRMFSYLAGKHCIYMCGNYHLLDNIYSKDYFLAATSFDNFKKQFASWQIKQLGEFDLSFIGITEEGKIYCFPFSFVEQQIEPVAGKELLIDEGENIDIDQSFVIDEQHLELELFE